MRKIVVSEFLSLDGVMEGPGPVDPFERAGWTMKYWDEGVSKLKFDELFTSDALLLGRVTYTGFAAAWPAAKDQLGFADRMNAMPKYVVSTTLRSADWNNSTIINGQVIEEIARLKEQPGKDILVAGSGALIETLMRNNLVDDYQLLVYPVIVGSGKRLFKDGVDASMKLVESRPFDTGVVLLHYTPASAESK